MKHLLLVSGICSALVLGGCSSDDDDSPSTSAAQNASFDVTVTNLTNAQPLSPVAIVMHRSGYHAFVDGETASIGLEVLAEGGDNSDLLTEAQAASEYIVSAGGQGLVTPMQISNTYTLEVPVTELGDVNMSLLSMLVNTNDGFSAVDSLSLSNLSTGQSLTVSAPTWDAGTEANSEAADTIPGQSGVGYSSVRDDIIDRVRFHGGVVTADDGLATSGLGQEHRFDNPTMRVSVTRTN